MTTIPIAVYDGKSAPRKFQPKSVKAGRQRKTNGLVELTVHVTPEQRDGLQARAEFDDRSISAQIRRDIDRANKRFNGNI